MYPTPKVTVAIPLYNVEPYVYRCINSVFDQDYDNIEILIVYDISIDNTLLLAIDCLRKGNLPYSIIEKREENKGIGNSRNLILDNFQGDYLFFLDSDDFLEPLTISLLVNKAIYTDADIVAASHKSINEEGNLIEKYQYTDKVFFDNSSFQHYVFVENGYFSIYSWNKLYKASFLKENNIRYIHDIVEDAVFSFLEIKKVNKIVLLHHITLNYLIRSSSITNAIMYNDLSLNIAKIYLAIRDFKYSLNEDGSELVDICSNVDAFFFGFIMTIRNSYKSRSITNHEKLNLCRSAFITPKIPIGKIFQLLYSKKTRLILLLLVKMLPFRFNMLLVKLYHKIKIV
jgi:glycosyltransferase involved in cell wall biosynthesis